MKRNEDTKTYPYGARNTVSAGDKDKKFNITWVLCMPIEKGRNTKKL